VAKSEYTMLELAGHEVRLSNPGKVYFPKPGWTKLDLAEYYVGMADAVLVHVRERPTVMKRFVNGIMEDPIWQKRVPQKVPDWLQTATVAFPSGRTAEELVANDAAHLSAVILTRPDIGAVRGPVDLEVGATLERHDVALRHRQEILHVGG
jgi:DNA primase